MKEPTDRTLIDAMALRIRQGIAPVDLDRDREFRDRFNEAGRIVLEYVTRRMAEPAPSMDVDSPELTDEQLSRLRPARGPGEPRLIEADELIVTTRDVDFAIECQRSMKPRRPVWFNGLHFAVTQIAQAGFDNRWVLTLKRCHPMAGFCIQCGHASGGHEAHCSIPAQLRAFSPHLAESREGTLTTEARVNYEGGAFIDLMVEHYKSGYEVRVSVRLVERDDDPYHGLTLSGFAFYQTLEEAFTSAGSITLEFDGKTYTRAWIKSLTKEA